MSAPLPTPVEAMRQAVERAQLGDIEGGNLWLGIARELRLGARPAPPLPRPLEREQVNREDTPLARHAEYEASLADGYAGETAVARVNRISREALAEDTVVLDGPFADCGNCRLPVELKLDQVPAIWVHVMTSQAACPLRNPDQTHSFAAPLVDERG